MARRERISAGAGLLEEMRAFAVVAKSIDQEALEVAARAVGWVPLADVLDALRNAKAWDQFIADNWGPGWPNDVRPKQAQIAADYLAERFATTAPEGDHAG